MSSIADQGGHWTSSFGETFGERDCGAVGNRFRPSTDFLRRASFDGLPSTGSGRTGGGFFGKLPSTGSGRTGGGSSGMGPILVLRRRLPSTGSGRTGGASRASFDGLRTNGGGPSRLPSTGSGRTGGGFFGKLPSTGSGRTGGGFFDGLPSTGSGRTGGGSSTGFLRQAQDERGRSFDRLRTNGLQWGGGARKRFFDGLPSTGSGRTRAREDRGPYIRSAEVSLRGVIGEESGVTAYALCLTRDT